MVLCFLERFKEIMWQSLYISDIPSTAGSIILRDRQGKLGSGDRSLLAGKTVTTVQYYGKNTVKWDYFILKNQICLRFLTLIPVTVE